jgi:hypothetical protein
MRMKKELPPHVSVVKGRNTKKSPFSVQGHLNCFVFLDKDAEGEQLLEPRSAHIEIRATAENWQTMEDFIFADPDRFCQEIRTNFIEPALQVDNKSLSQKDKLAETIKRESRWLHAFLRYWVKTNHPNSVPDYVKKLLKMIEDKYGSFKRSGLTDYSEAVSSDPPDNQTDVLLLTQFCMEEVYKDRAHILGLYPFEDADSFRVTYCSGSGFIYNSFIFKKGVPDNPSYVENLPTKVPPLGNILKKLKVL